MVIDDGLRELVREEMRRVLREDLLPVISELQSATPAQREFLPVPEAAELLRVSETTVREWMANGLMHYKHGKVTRIRRSDLLAFLSWQASHEAEADNMEQKVTAFLK